MGVQGGSGLGMQILIDFTNLIEIYLKYENKKYIL